MFPDEVVVVEDHCDGVVPHHHHHQHTHPTGSSSPHRSPKMQHLHIHHHHHPSGEDDEDNEELHHYHHRHLAHHLDTPQHFYVLEKGLTTDGEPCYDQDTGEFLTGFEDDDEDDEYKWAYTYQRRPLSPVDVDESGTLEISQRAQQQAKRLASSFTEECDSLLRKSRKNDAKALNGLHGAMQRSFISPPSPKVNRKPVYGNSDDEDIVEEHRSSSTTKYRPMDGHRPHDVICKSTHKSGEQQPPQKKYWWRDIDIGKKEEEETKLSAREKRQRIEAKLDGILDYEVPITKHYSLIKHSLRDMEDKLEKHRLLVNRYSAVDLEEKEQSLEERIQLKSDRLMEKLPYHSCKKPTGLAADEQREIYNYSPLTTMGYTTGLSFNDGSQTSELRGRLRRLICRSKKNPHYYRY